MENEVADAREGNGRAAVSRHLTRVEWSTADAETWGHVLRWLTVSKKKIPTPFPAMDWLCGGGNREGWATAIVGVDSCGKSLIAGASALTAAAGGFGVGIINLDMGYLAWLLRALATMGNLSATDLWEVEAQADFLRESHISDVAQKIRSLPGEVVIDDRRPRTSEQAAEIIRRWGERGIDLAVVDYCQLLRPANPNLRGADGFDEVIGDLVNAARAEAMALLLICQLNREAKKDQRPRLYHVLGGSAIERHCDVGVVLDHTTIKSFDGEALIRARCEKNRHLGRLPEWDVLTNKRTLEVRQGHRFIPDWRVANESD